MKHTKVFLKYIGEELALFWFNPWNGSEEKIATFWWPAHPIDATDEAEKLFEDIGSRACNEQNYKKMFELKQDDWIEACKDADKYQKLCEDLAGALGIAKKRFTNLLSSIDVILKIDDDIRNRNEVMVKGSRGQKDVTLPPSSILTLAKFAQDSLVEIEAYRAALTEGEIK